jgi:hypothetical protein
LPAIFNLAISKGAVFQQTFEFRHGLRLLDDLLPDSSETIIRINPLSIDLPANYRLRFPIKPQKGRTSIDLITTTSTPAGNDTVAILPYTGNLKIPYGSVAPTLPHDLTGQNWRGSLRAEYNDADPLLQFSFTKDLARGLVTMKAVANLTANLPPNAIYSDLPADLQVAHGFSPKIWQDGYFWDAEYELPSLDVYRAFNGRCWVTPEVTR